MTRLRIVDVCGTLVRDDTTLGLLDWHFSRERRWRLWGLRLLTARWSPLRLCVAVLERLTRRHLLKHFLVRGLRGSSLAGLEASAEGYAEWVLTHRRNHEVSALLDREPGLLVLASASLEPVIMALAKRLDARYVGSSLEVLDGRYTGRYSRDLTGQKLPAIEALLGPVELAECLVVTDNLSDRSLIAQAGRAFVVVHKRRHRKHWEGLDVEYLVP